ncbi:hypothetical protein [Paenibacillus sp. WLX2291]|uniref:hypothetical protein n=1 Tax=Paenibacillus sp. WLX2291 TaxID=3296934 RepID=UPI003983EF46
MNQNSIVSFYLMTLEDLQNEEIAKKCIKLMNKNSEISPDKFDRSEPLRKKINWDQIDLMINTWMNEEVNVLPHNRNVAASGEFLAKRNKQCKAEFQFSWTKNQYAHFNFMNIDVNAIRLNKKDGFPGFLNLCLEYIQLLKPVYGCIKIMHEFKSDPINLEVRYPHLEWLNIFGEPYVKLFGHKKLLNTPAYKIHDISDSIVGVQLTESIYQDIPKEIRESVKEYLGKQAFMEDGKSLRRHKPDLVPNFDYSMVLINPERPVEDHKAFNRYK